MSDQHPMAPLDHSFRDEVRSTFRSTPWFAVSALLHGLVVLLLFNVPWSNPSPRRAVAINTSILEPRLDPPIPPRLDDPTDTQDKPDLVVEPIISEPETPFESEDVSPRESSYDAPSLESLIGLGGGTPGYSTKYGIRSGGGGNRASQRAVDRGLDWLHRHQHEDGHWGGETFQLTCEPDQCLGPGHATVDVGLTGLALLAFLGADHTPVGRTRYRQTVRRGLRWLCDQQGVEIEGLFGSRAGQYFMYSHALATLAVCEGFGLSNQPHFKPVAQRSIDFITRARNPHAAWRYSFPPTGRSDDNDVSVTGWMVFALSSANDFGLHVEASALRDALSYLDTMTDPATGRTGYDSRGSWSSREEGDDVRWPRENVECMTAVAMLCRMLLQEDKSVAPETIPELKKGAELLAKKPPRYESGHVDYYYWYYGSYAMYQMSGAYWNDWSQAMERAILNTQIIDSDSCEQGSWDSSVDPWGDVGGRVYATALCVLSLEVYYRYDRILGSR